MVSLIESEIFQRIASVYEFMNFVMTFGLIRRWRKKAISFLYPIRGLVLDCGSGTGVIQRYIDKERTKVISLDPSLAMLKYIIKNYPDSCGTVIKGVAETLPLKNNSFENAFTFFTYRNFYNSRKAVEELIRILKPQGKLVIMDAFMPDNLLIKVVHTIWLGIIIPIVAFFIGRFREYRYLYRSIKKNELVGLLELEAQMKQYGTTKTKKIMGGYITILIFTKSSLYNEEQGYNRG